MVYLVKRILLLVPTLFGIIVINFAVVQVAPGGPVQTVIAQIKARDVGDVQAGFYRGAEGLDQAAVAAQSRRFGIDWRALPRLWLMVRG